MEPPPPDSDSGSKATSKGRIPVYTPHELAAMFLDFYQFLATLHYDRAKLKIAPPGGWPGLTVEHCAGFKSNLAIEVLRRLPYFKNTGRDVSVHYKSDLVDYTALGRGYFRNEDRSQEYAETEYFDGDWHDIELRDVVFIAWGHESGGRDLMLDVRRGAIIEEEIRIGHVGVWDVRAYFDRMKDAYRTLKLIPWLGDDVVEAWDVDERDDEISIQELLAQNSDYNWLSYLDTQYGRQIYRQHGWPDAFRKDDMEKAVTEAMEQRGVFG
jgi:hypothetical protein